MCALHRKVRLKVLGELTSLIEPKPKNKKHGEGRKKIVTEAGCSHTEAEVVDDWQLFKKKKKKK